MIEIGLHRTPSRRVACFDVRQSGQGDRSHGWQDKSRKVRPVGRLGNVSNFNHAPNIVKIRHNLPFSPRRCFCSVFDTLRRAR
ncbi:MAG: hypothetical protein DI543_13190 [Bradyrhizobium icense]|nr:MAG: hypothetical protein DI543_13190 [Bradyrhizobium icense]